jgi:hypothetical protein
MQSVKRTSEPLDLRSPVSRALVFLLTLTPALKCWAIFKRPLRGLSANALQHKTSTDN